MPREIPQNMVAAIANTHQTQENNADPKIICDLTYAVSRFAGWASFRQTFVNSVQGNIGGANRIKVIAQAYSHPVLNDTTNDRTYVLWEDVQRYPWMTVQVFDADNNPQTSEGWTMSSGISLSGTSMDMIYAGSVQQGNKGPEFVTSGYPYVAIAIGGSSSSKGKLYVYQLNTDNHTATLVYQDETPENNQHMRCVQLVCPAVLDGGLTDVYVFYSYMTTTRETTGYVRGACITGAGTPVNITPGDFVAIGMTPEGGIAMEAEQIIFNTGTPLTETYIINELWSTTNPLTFGSPTDVTTKYTIMKTTTDPDTHEEVETPFVLYPGWTLVFADGTIQRIGAEDVAAYQNRYRITYQSVAKSRNGDYAGATWSSWIPLSGERANGRITGMHQYPNGILRNIIVDDQTGSAMDPKPVEFFYGVRSNTLHLGDATADGSITMRNDNGIAQLSLTLHQNDIEFTADDDSPMRPGTRIDVALQMGDSDEMPLIAAKIDEANIDVAKNTYSISGRNITGYNLSAASFYTKTTLTGTCNQMAAAIFAMAGVDDYDAMVGSYSFTLTFDANTSALDALKKICDYFTSDSIVFEMVELPGGKIVIGYRSWINANYQTTGYYEFSGSKCWKHNIRRSADAAYAMVHASGQDSHGNDLTPTTAPITNDVLWDIPENKIYYVTAPGELTQAQLQQYADNLAVVMSMAGVTHTYTGSIHPEIIIGDVAKDTDKDEVVGIVTSIRHKFGAAGFATEFSTDTGGLIETVVPPGEDPPPADAVITQTKSDFGNTRKQAMTDIMTSIATGVAKSIAIGLVSRGH